MIFPPGCGWQLSATAQFSPGSCSVYFFLSLSSARGVPLGSVCSHLAMGAPEKNKVHLPLRPPHPGLGSRKSKPSRGSSSPPAAGSAICVLFSVSAYLCRFLVFVSKGRRCLIAMAAFFNRWEPQLRSKPSPALPADSRPCFFVKCSWWGWIHPFGVRWLQEKAYPDAPTRSERRKALTSLAPRGKLFDHIV